MSSKYCSSLNENIYDASFGSSAGNYSTDDINKTGFWLLGLLK
jgi:hypothetical protein